MGYNPGAAQRIWGVIKMFYNWIVALVTGLNAFVKTKNYILRRMDFTIKTLFLNKLAKKNKTKTKTLLELKGVPTVFCSG